MQRESRTICYHVEGKEQCQVETRTREFIPSNSGNHPCNDERSSGPQGDPRCQVKVQGPPQESSSQGLEGVPPHVKQRKLVNIDSKQAGKVKFGFPEKMKRERKKVLMSE